MKPLAKEKQTSRGFALLQFKDHNGVRCSLQTSSLAIYEEPGTSAIWLGCDDANPRHLIPGEGWKPIAMPKDYLSDTRIHLNREQVDALILHLQQWMRTGSFDW